MTYGEFLEKLAETREKLTWQVLGDDSRQRAGRIRGFENLNLDGQRRLCPITAIRYVATGEFFSESDAEDIGQESLDSYIVTAAIIDAADGAIRDVDKNRAKIRADMLRVLGLEEKP